MRCVKLLLGVLVLSSVVASGQDLNPADVRISLDEALPMALKAASKEFPDLHEYILYSVTPRVLKGDRRGLHWQVEWREKAFPHHKLLRVRVYMGDGSVYAERLEKGEYQKAQLASAVTTHDYAGFSLTFFVVGTPEFMGPPKITDPAFVPPFTEIVRLPTEAACLAKKSAGSYEALIEKDGSVASVTSLYEPISGDQCEQTFLFRYIKKWHFRPATYNGKPTPVFLRFSLK